jgi:hypothetical protein
VELFSWQAVAGPEIADLREDLLLLSEEIDELVVSACEIGEELRHQRTDRTAALRRPDPRLPVHLVGAQRR